MSSDGENQSTEVGEGRSADADVSNHSIKRPRREVVEGADIEVKILAESFSLMMPDSRALEKLIELTRACLERCFIRGEINALQEMQNLNRASIDELTKKRNAIAQAMRFNDA